MRYLIIALLISGVAATALGTPLSKEDQRVATQAYAQRCFINQRKLPINVSMSDFQLKEYCECIGIRAAELISYEDIALYVKTKSDAHMVPLVQSASKFCGG